MSLLGNVGGAQVSATSWSRSALHKWERTNGLEKAYNRLATFLPCRAATACRYGNQSRLYRNRIYRGIGRVSALALEHRGSGV